LPERLSATYHKHKTLRYGENPHQNAGLYVTQTASGTSLVYATQHQGKAKSYNNLADADAALRCIQSFDTAPTCVIVKHANPCGVATGTDLKSAYQRAFATDPTSSFGGILAFNGELDFATAEQILSNQFAEVILAPSIAP